jgi:hypothetical protein
MSPCSKEWGSKLNRKNFFNPEEGIILIVNLRL